MCNKPDNIEATICIPPSFDLAIPSSDDYSSVKFSMSEASEIEGGVSSDFSSVAEDDGDDVFRQTRQSIVEEMFLVLKRANPVSETRDDYETEEDDTDGEGYPTSLKRRRRFYEQFNDDEEASTKEGLEENNGANVESYNTSFDNDDNECGELIEDTGAAESRLSFVGLQGLIGDMLTRQPSS